MNRAIYPAVLLVIVLLLAPLTVHHAADLVTDKVDWPAFLQRQDLVFETLPTQFDYGAFLGNGLLGAMIYRDGDSRLRWEMGRSDVTEHRRDNNRLPIGGLVLETIGTIQDGTMRLDLWNAELRGSVTTDKGTLEFRTLIHAEVMAMILDLKATGEEKTAKFVWVAGHGQDKRNQQKFNICPTRRPRPRRSTACRYASNPVMPAANSSRRGKKSIRPKAGGFI